MSFLFNNQGSHDLWQPDIMYEGMYMILFDMIDYTTGFNHRALEPLTFMRDGMMLTSSSHQHMGRRHDMSVKQIRLLFSELGVCLIILSLSHNSDFISYNSEFISQFRIYIS